MHRYTMCRVPYYSALTVVGSDGEVCVSAERECAKLGVEYVLEKRQLISRMAEHLAGHSLQLDLP